MLPFSCSSVWSAPPPARWGNSVLNAAPCPRNQVLDPLSALLLEVGLSPDPCSQLFCISQSLLGAINSFVRLACHPTPALSLYPSPNLCRVLVAPLGGWLVTLLPLSVFAASPTLIPWEFGTESLAPCPTPILWGRFSVPLPPVLSVLDYSLLFMFFSFVGEVVQSAQGLLWIIFLEDG
jgi:hypothetical protein